MTDRKKSKYCFCERKKRMPVSVLFNADETAAFNLGIVIITGWL